MHTRGAVNTPTPCCKTTLWGSLNIPQCQPPPRPPAQHFERLALSDDEGSSTCNFKPPSLSLSPHNQKYSFSKLEASSLVEKMVFRLCVLGHVKTILMQMIELGKDGPISILYADRPSERVGFNFLEQRVRTNTPTISMGLL